MTPLEIAGVVTGALSVWFAARQNWLTWPIGLVNIAAFLVMFWHEKLYSDVLLHCVYLGLTAYGWSNWGTKDELKVIRLAHFWPYWVVIVLTILSSLGTFLAICTDAAFPYLDSFVAGMSILACYLMSRKALECWLIYVVSDVVAISIYAVKGLDLTAALYLLYLVLCVKGYRSWRASV